MKKKTIVSLLLTTAMIASMLVGCGAKDDAKAPAADDNQPAADAGADADADADADAGSDELEYVELNWYSAIFDQPDGQMILDALNEYLLEKINVKVNVIRREEDNSKITGMLGAGEDLIVSDAGLGYQEMVAQGAYLPIGDLIDEYAPGIKALFTEEEWGAMTIDGEIYAFPSKKDNFYPIGMFYNRALAEEIGVDMNSFNFWNWSWDAETEQFWIDAKAKRDALHPEWAEYPILKSPGMAGVYNYAFEAFLDDYLVVCDIDGIDDFKNVDSNTVFNFYETEEFRNYCLMMQRMVEAGVYAYDYENMDGLVGSSEWGLGSTSWGTVFTPEEENWQLRMLDRPSYTDTAQYTGTIHALSANCANPERAMMFLEIVNTDPYVATLLRFGIEGEHYIYDADGYMTMVGSPRNGDPNAYGYVSWFGGCFGNMFAANVPVEFAGKNNESTTIMQDLANNLVVPAHMGFVLDTTPITGELAACSNVVAQYQKDLIKGQYETQDACNAALDSFIADLKAAGVDTIVAETQAQLDAWTAAN